MLAAVTLYPLFRVSSSGPHVSRRHICKHPHCIQQSAITTTSDAYTVICRSLYSDWPVDPVAPYLDQSNVHQTFAEGWTRHVG
ncbi:hypothetical protein IQ06DRAFT_290997 [Phaeosphaeriaceae sp. SRC1lsM3a]|nr:hypothetical protein IQ06DRAFT_290997 [Stagonospora sp. SRC1lsM3a]